MIRLSWYTRNLGRDQLNLWTQQNTFIISIFMMTFFISSMDHSMDGVLYLRQYCIGGARGDIVVKALRYNLAGRGFNSRRFHWNFSVT